MSRPTTFLKAAGRRVMRHPVPRMAAIRAAAWRGHGLALVYHRVTGASPAPGGEVVPSVDCARFRAQVTALGELGDVVDLPALLDPPASRRRPRFSVTFDDDYPHHVTDALPVLRDLGVPGTFFLSGRALHGLGPYWWERLERLVAARGVVAAGHVLGIAAHSPQALAAACEADLGAQRRLATLAPAGERPLDVDGIRALVEAGMTLGFHTVDHPVLPTLDDDGLATALSAGRDQLAAVAGRPLTLLAYPHGKADARVAGAARAAGYRAAWTGWPRPARAGRDDPFLLGRWEPGPLDLDAFVAAVGVRLHRTPGTGGVAGRNEAVSPSP